MAESKMAAMPELQGGKYYQYGLLLIHGSSDVKYEKNYGTKQCVKIALYWAEVV